MSFYIREEVHTSLKTKCKSLKMYLPVSRLATTPTVTVVSAPISVYNKYETV